MRFNMATLLNEKLITAVDQYKYILLFILVSFSHNGFCQTASNDLLEYKSPNMDSLQNLSKKNLLSFIISNEANFETKLNNISIYLDTLSKEKKDLERNNRILIEKNQEFLSAAVTDSIKIRKLSDSLVSYQLLIEQNNRLIQSQTNDSILIVNLKDSLKNLQSPDNENQLKDTYISNLSAVIDSSKEQYTKEIFPAEGDGDYEVTVYKKDNQIVKIECEGYATMSSLCIYYYFDNNQLVFTKMIDTQYDMPFYMEDHQVESIKESAYYFSKNLLFLSIEENEKNLDKSYLSLKQIELMTDFSVILVKISSN